MKLIDRQGKKYLVESVGSKWGIVKDKNGARKKIPISYLLEECQRLDEASRYDRDGTRDVEELMEKARMNARNSSRNPVKHAYYVGELDGYEHALSVDIKPSQIQRMLASAKRKKWDTFNIPDASPDEFFKGLVHALESAHYIAKHFSN